MDSVNEILIRNYPMSMVTSLGVGGPADYFLRPCTPKEIQTGLDLAAKNHWPVTVIGYGTNLLVLDKGIRGLVIQIADNLAQAQANGTQITAEAGCSVSGISRLAASLGLCGLEFAIGIPGSIGGAVYMNAGAYDQEIGPLVTEVRWVSPQGHGVWKDGEYTYGYRTSRAQSEKVIITQITLQLAEGDPCQILATCQDLQNRRYAKQPMEYPSAGSTFKRPTGHFAGSLIEKANLKGYSIGGAKVSEKHAGFIINTGKATAKDVLDLITHIQQTVKNRFGVELEPEIRIIGEE
jgi:UDP-N-acetylmuramate dehydrogenase